MGCGFSLTDHRPAAPLSAGPVCATATASPETHPKSQFQPPPTLRQPARLARDCALERGPNLSTYRVPTPCLRQLDAPANDATKASSGRDRNSERATWFPDAPQSTTKAWKWLPRKVSALPQGLEPSPRGSTARDGSANQTPSTHVEGAPCVNLPTMRSRRATEQARAQLPAQRTALNGQGNALPNCPEGEVPDAGRQLGNRRVAGLQPQGKTLKGEEAGGAGVHNATATSKSGLSGFTAQHVAA
jgi:hypothetical protein